MEHGRKPIPKQLIHQVHEYFGSETYTLKDWIELSDASPLQLKLNLVDADEIEREVYMAVAKRFHSAPHEVKEEIRQFISERLNAAEGHEKEVHRNGI